MAASLRSFRDGDRGSVLDLSRRALARPEEQVGNPVWSTREELDAELAGWQVAPEETLLVEEDDEGVAGFGGVEILPGWHHVELYGPLVAPRSRGQKLGSSLLEASLDVARGRGATRVIGAVGTRNASGRLLLEHHGFHPRDVANAVFRLVPETHRPAADAPPGVEVRRAGPSDLEATLALYRETFPEGSFPDAEWERALAQGGVYLAERGGRPIAFLDIDASDRWVYHVGVSARERQRGVGSYLVSRALAEYWREHPGEQLGLSVVADNVPALRLYRRQGFAPWLVLQSLELAL